MATLPREYKNLSLRIEFDLRSRPWVLLNMFKEESRCMKSDLAILICFREQTRKIQYVATISCHVRRGNFTKSSWTSPFSPATLICLFFLHGSCGTLSWLTPDVHAPTKIATFDNANLTTSTRGVPIDRYDERHALPGPSELPTHNHEDCRQNRERKP